MKAIISICYFFTEYLLLSVLLLYCKKVLNKNIKYNIHQNILLIIMVICLVLNNYYNLVSLRLLTSMIIVFITIKSIYKPSFKDSLYHTIIFSIIGMVVEVLISVTLLVYIPNVEILNTHYFIKIFISIVYVFVMYIILTRNVVIELINKIRRVIKMPSIIIFVLIIMNILIIYRAYLLNNAYVLLLSIICSIFIVITLKVIVNDKYNISILYDKNKNLKESYKAYSETIEQCRIFKHNIKNELFALKSNLPSDQQQKINEIISENNKNYEWINKIDDIPEGLQGMFFLKQNEAKNKNIAMIINTSKKILIRNADYMDLCEILGIFLDNAIEASKAFNKKVIDVSINETMSSINITIKNKFKNNIDINKLGRKNYSTKKYKSGLGLNYVNKINNSKIKVQFKIIENIFISNITYIIN